MNPWLIVAAILYSVALAGGGYWRGHHDASNACEAAKVAQMEADRQATAAKTAGINKESEKLEVGNANAKVVYRTITRTVDKIVERPVYRNVCLDDDGVLAANAALAGQPADTGQPDDTVPGLKPPGGRVGGIGLKKTD